MAVFKKFHLFSMKLDNYYLNLPEKNKGNIIKLVLGGGVTTI